MSEQVRTVEMVIVNPGTTAPNDEFVFELQARYNPARTVKFALTPQDAELLSKHLTAYLAELTKA
jgi:hypothetical protein